MPKPRKKWSTTQGPDAPSQADLRRKRFTSERKAFEQVARDRVDYLNRQHGFDRTHVWVDDGGRAGWELFETISHTREAG